jgi:hypothetical protein
MKETKKEDRLFFIIQPVSFWPLYNASFFGRRDIPAFLKSRKGNNKTQ